MSFTLVRHSNSKSHFQHFEIGEFTVSVQASENHYCAPRFTFSSSDNYDSFEVAVWTRNTTWFRPMSDPRFASAAWARYWDTDGDVAMYVPRKEVEAMLEDLRSIA